MRDPLRIPMILSAIARQWEREPERRLGQLLTDLAQPGSDGSHPLWGVTDARLFEVLRRTGDDNGPVGTEDRRPSRAELLAAVHDRWQANPDMRLGQLAVNVIRDHYGKAEDDRVFGIEDGALLRRIGPASGAEENFIAEEPAARSRGWREWHEGPVRRTKTDP